MAVSGNPENRHGIILAKNEAAKKFGIKTAETIWQAKAKCPHLILLPPNHDKYEYYSQKVNEIYARFTNMVEPFGIDESWLDVTRSLKLFGSGKEIADKIRRAVREELGLTVSVGVSFNKVFAKLASDYKKPDATTVIMREDVEKTVYPCPARDMIFVGRSSAEALSKMDIRTIGELAAADPNALIRRFGKLGAMLSEYARGLDDSPVGFYLEEAQAKSIGNSITFKRDLKGLADIKAGLMELAQKVSARLKAEKVKCGVLQITLRAPNFSTFTRQCTLENPSNLTREIFENALKILKSSWDVDSPIRMLGIAGGHLCDASAPVQADLFADKPKADLKKTALVEEAFFKVRERYGKSAIKYGTNLKRNIK